jgi:hypothetical protein
LLKEQFRRILEKVHDRQKATGFLSTWILRAESTGDKYLAKLVAHSATGRKKSSTTSSMD